MCLWGNELIRLSFFLGNCQVANFRNHSLRDIFRSVMLVVRMLVSRGIAHHIMSMYLCVWELPLCARMVCKHARICGGILNSPWNYNGHETTTVECSNSTSRRPKAVTAVKWRLLQPASIERQQLHSQQPPNYNNSKPTTVKWRVRSSTIRVVC